MTFSMVSQPGAIENPSDIIHETKNVYVTTFYSERKDCGGGKEENQLFFVFFYFKSTVIPVFQNSFSAFPKPS